MANQQNDVIVAMVPFPAQGHLNQLLHLSRLIIAYNIPVHYLASATHNRQAKHRVHGWVPQAVPLASTNIHFHDLEVPQFISPPPDPNSKVKFPSHLQPSFDAASSVHLRESVADLLRSLACTARKVIVIFDSLMRLAIQDVEFISNAEAYTFHSISVFSYFLYVWERMEKLIVESQLVEEIPSEIPSLEGCFSDEFLNLISSNYVQLNFKSTGSIYNTNRIIEGTYVKLMVKLMELEATPMTGSNHHWALGPFNPVTTTATLSSIITIDPTDAAATKADSTGITADPIVAAATKADSAFITADPTISTTTNADSTTIVADSTDAAATKAESTVITADPTIAAATKTDSTTFAADSAVTTTGTTISATPADNQRRHHCLEWLDKKPQNSVVYVSFGTTTALSDDQISEIAIGLKQSNKNFIWVLRDADKGDIFSSGGVRTAELPKGYEDSVKENGLVIRDWAPQLEILAHRSTGGFISHCGWNSCMESITMGVPIGAWPMHSDQPRNTLLITEVLKVGIVVKNWEERDEIVSAPAVESGVRRLMEGDEVRKRAAEMGCRVRESVSEGGVTRAEFDDFIAHISR